jgi:hypothetical protein
MKREQGLRNGYIHLIVARHDRIYTHIFISWSLGTTVYIRTYSSHGRSARPYIYAHTKRSDGLDVAALEVE